MDRHEPAYRREFSGGLVARWSTVDDRAGLALTSGIAWGARPGFEDDASVIFGERVANDEYYYGHSRWAICVGTNGPVAFPRSPDNKTLSNPEADRIRQAASQVAEPVLAIVSYHLLQWSMNGHPIKIAKHCLVASRPECRLAAGGAAGIVKELFAMCQERANHEGAAFFHVMGIPNYYRSHGFEHAIRFGPGFVSPTPLARSVKTSTEYTSRPGQVADMPTLVSFYDKLNRSSPLWQSVAGPIAVQGEIRWQLGHRPPSFPVAKHPHVPCLVIEQKDKIVAAVIWSLRQEVARPLAARLFVVRLIYDPEADLPVLAKEIVARAWEFQKGLAAAEVERLAGLGIDSDTSLDQVTWQLSADFPIMLAAEAAGVAVRQRSSPVYSLPSQTYVAIHSLPNFFAQLRPVIDVRLAAAQDRIGRPTLQLRFATYSSSYTGCALTIESGRLASIQPRQFTGAQIVAFSDPVPTVGEEDVPNVIGPYGALVKLLMGFASLDQIRWIVPDLSVREDVRHVVEAAFPVLRSVSLFYG